MQSIVFLLIWPGTVGALLLGYFGHATRRVMVAALGSALGLPLLLYLAATPRFQMWASAVVLTNLASVVALGMKRQRLAVALFSLYPVFLTICIALIVAR